MKIAKLTGLLAAYLLTANLLAEPMSQWKPGKVSGYNGRVCDGQVTTNLIDSNHKNFPVSIYYPPKFDPSKRYPVLYALDGQQYFHDQGKNWGLDETLDKLISAGEVKPLIVVAVGTGDDAFRKDYFTAHRTFSPNDGRDWQGKAKNFLAFLLELKRRVDKELPTDPNDSGLLGSSLGGLFSLYAGFNQPGVFKHVAAMSPSLMVVHRKKQDTAGEPWIKMPTNNQWPEKFWMDMGNKEGPAAQNKEFMGYAVDLDKWFHGQNGYRAGHYHFQPYTDVRTNQHDETCWGNRAWQALTFLYPAH